MKRTFGPISKLSREEMNSVVLMLTRLFSRLRLEDDSCARFIDACGWDVLTIHFKSEDEGERNREIVLAVVEMTDEDLVRYDPETDMLIDERSVETPISFGEPVMTRFIVPIEITDKDGSVIDVDAYAIADQIGRWEWGIGMIGVRGAANDQEDAIVKIEAAMTSWCARAERDLEVDENPQDPDR